MIYVIVIFFILELFAAVTVCVLISALDKKVNVWSENFKVNRHTLKFKLRAVYDIANSTKNYVLGQKRQFIRKRREFSINILRKILITFILFFFRNTSLKKKILYMQLVFMIYDLFKTDCTV